MKTFKQIDFYVQLAAIILGIVLIPFIADMSFFLSYFLVGGLQVLSFLVHLKAGRQIGLTPARRKYGWALIITTLLVLVGWIFLPMLLIVLLLLLFAAPVMAIIYCHICYTELQLIKHENQQ